MRASFLLFLIGLSFSFSLNAQHLFQKTYGGAAMDEAKSVRQTTDMGYIMVGTTTSFGSGGRDVLVIKTNELGDTVWTRTFGGAMDNEYGFCVQQTTDEGYIVSGVASSFADVSGDMYVLKLTATGDTTWTRTYGGIGYEWGACIQQTIEGGYIVVGQTPAFGAGGFDAYLVKLDALGNISWTKTYGGSGLEIGSAVQQATDGGYILTGQIDSYGAGSGDFYLIKTDSIGTLVWTKAYGRSGTEAGVTVKQTTDGGYIMGGTSENALGPLGSDMCLIKTNSTGDTLWTKTYGGAMIDECYEVQQTSDGGYIMVGKSFSFSTNGDYDVYVVKTNNQGVVQWSKTYGGSTTNHNEIGYSIQQTADKGYIISGETMFGFGVGLKNIYLIKTDSLGNSGCNEGIPNTITAKISLQVISPPTLTASGGVMSYPATFVYAGTTQTNLCATNIAISEMVDGDKSVIAYPNPFEAGVNLLLDSPFSVTAVNIYDVMGQIMYSSFITKEQAETGNIILNLKSLKTGIYVCEIIGRNNYKRIKLMKK